MAIGSGDPYKTLGKTRSIIREGGWERLGQSVFGTLLLAVVFGGIDVLNALLSIPIRVLNALGISVAGLNTAVFDGLATFIGGFLTAGGRSFGTGWTGLLGPLQSPLGMGIFLFMLWEVAYYMDYVGTDVIGLVLDLPILQSDEADTGEEDT
ncbi:hypothetical protein [Halosimplex amylolyticum]|uniref:hypothetical protein n=1 Tax=Halosimplex amylolyticum TaxID=3396616 RepID=UPI003F57E644